MVCNDKSMLRSYRISRQNFSITTDSKVISSVCYIVDTQAVCSALEQYQGLIFLLKKKVFGGAESYVCAISNIHSPSSFLFPQVHFLCHLSTAAALSLPICPFRSPPASILSLLGYWSECFQVDSRIRDSSLGCISAVEHTLI